MDKQVVLESLANILNVSQRLIYPPLLARDNKFMIFYDDDKYSVIDIVIPKYNKDLRYTKHYTVEMVMDGLIDILYYIHFSFSKYIQPENRTAMMKQVAEFYESSRVIGSMDFPEIRPEFVWKMQLSELFEIMVLFGDTWKDDIYNIIPPRQETIDVRLSLPMFEQCILAEAEKLGISNKKFHEAFALVHGANMAKRFDDGTFHRDGDGKIIKPPNWQECDLTDIVNDILGQH